MRGMVVGEGGRSSGVLLYCTLLWANCHVTNIRKLQLLSKKAIRIITSSHYIAHTDPLFSMTKLLKLDDLMICTNIN